MHSTLHIFLLKNLVNYGGVVEGLYYFALFGNVQTPYQSNLKMNAIFTNWLTNYKKCQFSIIYIFEINKYENFFDLKNTFKIKFYIFLFLN